MYNNILNETSQEKHDLNIIFHARNLSMEFLIAHEYLIDKYNLWPAISFTQNLTNEYIIDHLSKIQWSLAFTNKYIHDNISAEVLNAAVPNFTKENWEYFNQHFLNCKAITIDFLNTYYAYIDWTAMCNIISSIEGLSNDVFNLLDISKLLIRKVMTIDDIKQRANLINAQSFIRIIEAFLNRIHIANKSVMPYDKDSKNTAIDNLGMLNITLADNNK